MSRVGTHTSIAKWPELAFERSHEVGGDTLQIFAKSPRGWRIPTYDEEQYVAWRDLRTQFGQRGGIVHSNYLVNLSKPVDEITREIDSVVHDFALAHKMWYQYVNVHIGKGKWFTTLDEPMRNMVRNVEHILTRVRQEGYDDVEFLFENTAGQWSEIGSTLDEMALFWSDYLHTLPVKFCIDTAHCQGGGIDVADREQFVDEFADRIGIDQLAAIHLNDSKAALWSRLDRHASLGRWLIGWPSLAKVIRWAHAHDRDLFIETPEPDLRPEEIEAVRRVGGGDDAWIEAAHAEWYGTQVLKKFEDLARQQQQKLL